uniref:Uncharacterized protein n=1 Tax=Anguilla anguilla TaxID=7936 RepID=A0A0E9X2K0_ANGAN
MQCAASCASVYMTFILFSKGLKHHRPFRMSKTVTTVLPL